MASSSTRETVTESPKIEFIHLPKGESSIAPYIQPYKDFRLKSLLLAPSAFIATYSGEVAFPDSTWKMRLLSPLSNIFIAQYPTSDYHSSHASESSSAPHSLSNANTGIEFLCTLAMLGPLSAGPNFVQASTGLWTLTTSTDQMLREAVRPWHFRINALFTMPEARGKGLAKDLVAMVLKFARDFTQQKKVSEREREDGGFVVSLAVEEHNIAASKLYEKCGFVRFGDFDYKAADGAQRKVLLFEYREDSRRREAFRRMDC